MPGLNKFDVVVQTPVSGAQAKLHKVTSVCVCLKFSCIWAKLYVSVSWSAEVYAS